MPKAMRKKTATPKRAPGRPTISGEARSQLMGVRAEPSAIKRWKAIASRCGMSFQAFVISACDAYAKGR